jgi:flagellar biosynthesis protein FlhB
MSSEERTEPATPKKIQEALKQGNRVRSTLVGQAVAVIAVGVVLAVAGPYSVRALMSGSILMFRAMDQPLDLTSQSIAQVVVMPVALLVVGMLLISLATICANIVLTHGQFAPAPEAIKLDVKKINPKQAVDKLKSPKTYWEIVRSLILLVVITSGLFFIVAGAARRLHSMFGSPGLYAYDVAKSVIVSALVFLIVLTFLAAILDLALQKAVWKKGLKMSKSEVKREHAQSEGNPQLKGQRRNLALEGAQERSPDDTKHINFAVIDHASKKILGICYAPDHLERPLVLMKLSGSVYDLARASLESSGVLIADSPPAIEILYSSSQPMNYIPAKNVRYLEALIQSSQQAIS